MEKKRYSIHLADEAPRLGSGERVVIAQVGRVWVYATREIGTMNRARIRRSVWDALAKREIETL